MIARTLAATALAGLALTAAAPAPEVAHFPQASTLRLPNGVIITAQISSDAPIASAAVFVPAGLAQQNATNAGIAAITAAAVLRTPVDNGKSLMAAAQAAGGDVAYTVDPEATRFEIEAQTSALPQLLADLAKALAAPDPSQFAAARTEVAAAAKSDESNPAMVAYAMVRQVRYQGTGFAFPQGGRSTSLTRLTVADMQRFAASYQYGTGTVIALAGALQPGQIDAVGKAFASWPARSAPPPPSVTSEKRQHEIVAHRNIQVPWLAVGYAAPSQFSKDFPAMLVIQALLGRGGDVHAFSFGSAGSAETADYVGAYYQYEARPGSFVIFFNGGSGDIDAGLKQLEEGISRLRSQPLPDELVTRAKKLALGDYYLSVTSLSDAAWLLGRSATSPDGAGFEDALAVRISSVSAADIQRVARQYLADETVAVVLPVTSGR
jgi:zinc protease